MTTFNIFFSSEARSSGWQLPGFLGTSQSVLIGWNQFPEAIDSGVPDTIVDVLSRALSSNAKVSFLSSDLDDDLEEIIAMGDKVTYSLQPVRDFRNIARLFARWFHLPSRMAVVTTSDPKVVSYLFDDACFSWSLQGQMAFLSDPSNPSPDLRGVISKAWWRKYQAAPKEVIARYGLTGVLRPGVDGDVVGILFRSSEDKDRFLTALQKEAKSSGMHLKMCDETEFMDSLAQQSQDVSQHEHPGA